jgi:hypothetical protein
MVRAGGTRKRESSEFLHVRAALRSVIPYFLGWPCVRGVYKWCLPSCEVLMR